MAVGLRAYSVQKVWKEVDGTTGLFPKASGEITDIWGDTVNLASRLEGANKVYGTSIIIDHATMARAGTAIATRPLDVISVVGRQEPLEIYELTEKITALRVFALAVNIVAVIWLLWSKRLFGLNGGGRAYRDEHEAESLLSVESAGLSGTPAGARP